ncbi:PIN domain-containing protein [Piscinibacter gummiphilus]|uniref:PIN domain-containing protein n=1 Tax=Piscinibacter gummiphilus TaxID=946333 RepID=UPI0015CFFC1F|nr:PIN domain-containing protein [Piscinibacter gummiphilus]GLS98203.1 PIN domain-containing protein [Piscinibacter gummiphilus]
MAGRARYTALLDACVLYPLAIADSLMSVAATSLYAAKWTLQIEREWMNALVRNRPDLAGRLEPRRDAMRDAVPDWEVTESTWRNFAEGEVMRGMPDPGDVHVLAAAIGGHADCIVTSNLKHFPEAIVSRFGIEVIDPDRFLVHQWDLDAIAVIAAFKRMRARWRRPQASAEDFASAMERGGCPRPQFDSAKQRN